MMAFDADVLTEILAGNPAMVARAAAIPVHDQAVPIVVIEEIIRGRLNSIRQAEAATSKLTLPRAYELFNETLIVFREVVSLGYSPVADDQYRAWRALKIRGGTHDLRIAAICIAHSATLITRNRRDFERLPELRLEVWG